MKKSRRKFKSLRVRRDEWFRRMFAELFAEWHEVVEKKKGSMYGLPWLDWAGRAIPTSPKAKHPDYNALKRRLKAVEQKVCDHTFCDRQKGCMESIFCSKCGALSPEWEKAPPKRWDEDDNVCADWVEPEVYADGTGYIRK